MEIVQKERWMLFYDGACPLCFRAKSKIHSYLNKKIKLTVVDLNSNIAKSKNYSNDQVVLETPRGTYFGYRAWIEILNMTKYSWVTHIFLRPIFILSYYLISKNRKTISKIIAS